MAFKDYAEKAAAKACEVLEAGPSADQASNVVHIIEEAIIGAVLEERERCADVALGCRSADRDMAHEIAAGIRQANAALIANLSSMR